MVFEIFQDVSLKESETELCWEPGNKAFLWDAEKKVQFKFHHPHLQAWKQHLSSGSSTWAPCLQWELVIGGHPSLLVPCCPSAEGISDYHFEGKLNNGSRCLMSHWRMLNCSITHGFDFFINWGCRDNSSNCKIWGSHASPGLLEQAHLMKRV